MINEQLKKAIIESGITHYRIWKDTGVDHRTIDRFVEGTCNIGINAAAILADFLGLELKPKTKGTK
jgi:plasmid maintenance system antidote protein VapI